MIATLFLLLAADPSGLSAALESADCAEVLDLRGRITITLKGAELKRLAKLIDCKDDVRPYVRPGGAIAAALVFQIRPLDKDGRPIGKFGLVNDVVQFNGKEVSLAKLDFMRALNEHFTGPRPKATFLPKVANELRTDVNIGPLTVREGGWVLFGVNKDSNRLHIFQTGSAGSVLKEFSQPSHDKLVTAHAIATTGRFVYLAGSSGIAGFRSASAGSFQFAPSEFIRDKAVGLHAADGKLYAARDADIWVYKIAGDYGRLRFEDITLVHPLLKRPTAMASASGHLYVVAADGALLTFKDDKYVSVDIEAEEADENKPGAPGKPCLTVVDNRLYTVGVGEGLAIWDVAKGKPSLVKRVHAEGDESKNLRSVEHIAVAGGRVWVAGYAGKKLAWFEWEDDELVFADSSDFGEIHSLAVSAPGPRGVRYLYLACEDSIKALTTEPPYNPIPIPEAP